MTPTPKPSLSTPASGNSSLVLPTPSSSTRSTRQQLERQIAEHEKLLQESNSGIGKNVLIRQISQLKEKLQQMDQQKPQHRRPNTEDNAPVLDKLRSLERDMTSYRSPRLLSSHPIPSPSTSGLDSSSLLPLPPPPTGSTPTKRRSKVPNADRRNTDIEFATEIGQGLLLEVRKMQALLQEKDEQLNQLEIQKADLERAAEAMAKQLRQREEVEERLKEDTWNLELAKQELTISVTELQQNLHKSTAEQNRLSRQMAELRSEIERLRSSEEKLNGIVETMKQRHEQDMSSVRRHAAGLQREKLDQKKQIDALTSELAIAKAQTRIAKRSYSDMQVAAKPEHAETMSSDASTDREQSPKTSPPPSPKQTPTRNQQLEVETLKTSLAHAHRMVSNLRSNLHKEKTEKFEFKKLLAESQETIEQLQNEPRMWEDANTDVKRSHRPNGASKRRKGSTKRKGQRVGNVRTQKGEEEEEEVDAFTDDDVTSSDEEEYPAISIEDSAGFTSLSSELSMSHPSKEMSLGDQLSMALSSSVQPRSAVDMGTQTNMETDSTEAVSPPGLQVVAMPSISAIPVQQETQYVQSVSSVPVDAGITVDIAKQPPPSMAISTQTSPVTMAPSIGYDSAVWTGATDKSKTPSTTHAATQLDTTTAIVGVAVATLSDETTSQNEQRAFVTRPAPTFENVPSQQDTTPEASVGLSQGPEGKSTIHHEVSPAENSFAIHATQAFADMPTLQFNGSTKSTLQNDQSPAATHTFANEATQVFDAVPNLALSNSTHATGTEYSTATTAAYGAPAATDAQTAETYGAPATPTFGTAADSNQTAHHVPSTTTDGVQSPAVYSTQTTATYDVPETDGVQSTAAHDISSTTEYSVGETTAYGAPAVTTEGVQSTATTACAIPVTAAYTTATTAAYGAATTESASSRGTFGAEATMDRGITATYSTPSAAGFGTSEATSYHARPETAEGPSARATFGTEATDAYGIPSTVAYTTATTAAYAAPAITKEDVPPGANFGIAATTGHGIPATAVYGTPSAAEFVTTATPSYGAPATADGTVARGTFGTVATTGYGVPGTPLEYGTTTIQSYETAPTVQVSESNQDMGTALREAPRAARAIETNTSMRDESTHVAGETSGFSAVQTSSHFANVGDESKIRGYGDHRHTPQFTTHSALGAAQSATEQTGEETKTLTQSEADAMAARAVEAALNAYRKQVKAASGEQATGEQVEEDQEHPPARPRSPPPSTLLSKAAARSLSVNSKIAPEYQEEYGTAYVNPHTMTYTSRRRESGSVSSVSTSNTTAERRPSITSSQLEAAARSVNSISDPNAIALITQTMIGDWMWKYTRKAVGTGLSERRHKRFFWIHPYTRTLYWSPHAPGVDGRESKAKSAFIEDVQAIPDYTQNPTGLPHISLLIQTPGRQLKITAPDTSRHEVWYESLSYLVARAGADGTSKKSIDRHDITESVSTSAVSILKKSSFQRLRPVRSISSIAGSARSTSSRSRVEDDDDDEGMEDVRMCCNGKHHVSKLEKDHHHHHHHPQHYRSTTKRSQLSS